MRSHTIFEPILGSAVFTKNHTLATNSLNRLDEIKIVSTILKQGSVSVSGGGNSPLVPLGASHGIKHLINLIPHRYTVLVLLSAGITLIKI